MPERSRTRRVGEEAADGLPFPTFRSAGRALLGRFFVGRAMRSIAGKLWQRDDKNLVFIRPLNEHAISGRHGVLSAFLMIWRTSLSWVGSKLAGIFLIKDADPLGSSLIEMLIPRRTGSLIPSSLRRNIVDTRYYRHVPVLDCGDLSPLSHFMAEPPSASCRPSKTKAASRQMKAVTSHSSPKEPNETTLPEPRKACSAY